MAFRRININLIFNHAVHLNTFLLYKWDTNPMLPINSSGIFKSLYA